MAIPVALAMALNLALSPVTPTAPGGGRVVVVAVFDRPPLVQTSATPGLPGHGGLFLELLEEVATREGWRLRRHPCAAEACLDALSAGAVDVVPAVPGRPGLDPGALLTSEAVISTWAQVWIRGGARVQSLLDLDRLAVALVAGDPSAVEVRALAESLGLHSVFAEVGSPRAALDALAKGWVDAAVVDRLDVLAGGHPPELTPSPLILSPVALHYAVRADPDRELQTTLDFHLRDFKRDPGSPYDRLVQDALGLRAKTRLPTGILSALAVTVGLLLVALGTGVTLRRQVRRATTTLAARNRELEGEVAMRLESEQALREAQKLEAFGQLAGGIAHDFNNLLQALMNEVELLRRRLGPSSTSDRTLAAIEHQLSHGAALARQLILFARKEVNHSAVLDLGPLVAEASTWLRRLVRENIAVRVEIAPQPLPTVADRGQLEQVLANLVVNAVFAMPDGGELALRTGGSGEEVWLEVEDDGVGMTPEVQARIFEPFFTTRPTGEGSGLGLAVVHGIVARHQGRVDLHTAPGAGSRFRVVLPRSPGGPPDLQARGDHPSTPSRFGAGERVLVVEDEEATREGLGELLSLLGYQATLAGSAEEAAELANTSEPFDVLLTDLTLPGATGLELAGLFMVRWPHLRVVVMSGYAAADEVREQASQGHIRFLQKPFSASTLADELADLVIGAGVAGGGAGAAPCRLQPPA